MNKTPRPLLAFLLLALSAALLPASATGVRAQSAPASRPAPELIGPGAEALAQRERDFAARSVAENAVAAFRAFLAEDAVQLPDNRPPIRGRDAICAWLEAAGLGGDQAVLDWWPLRAEVAKGGDLGYTFGDWEIHLKGAAATDKPLARGKFQTVWKKQPDGTWRVVLDGGNQYPAEKK